MRAVPHILLGVVNLVLSNCVVTAGKVHYSYKKPFDMLAEGSVSANWLGR